MSRFGGRLRALTLGAAVLAAAPAILSASPAGAADYGDADLPQLSTPSTSDTSEAGNALSSYIASRGLDGSLLYAERAAGAQFFTPFVSLGGQLVGDPTAVRTAEGVRIFVRGTDDQVYTNVVRPGIQASGFTTVPGLLVSGEIEAIRGGTGTGDNRVVVLFARGRDGAAWTNTLTNGVPSGWRSLGGFLTSNIAATRLHNTRNGTDSIQLVARGTDKRLYQATLTSAGPVNFLPLGNLQVSSNPTLVGDFAITSDLANGLSVYAGAQPTTASTASTPPPGSG